MSQLRHVGRGLTAHPSALPSAGAVVRSVPILQRTEEHRRTDDGTDDADAYPPVEPSVGERGLHLLDAEVIRAGDADHNEDSDRKKCDPEKLTNHVGLPAK